MLTTTPPPSDLDARPEPSCGECHDAPHGCNGCEPGSHCPDCRACWAAGEYCAHAMASDSIVAREVAA